MAGQTCPSETGHTHTHSDRSALHMPSLAHIHTHLHCKQMLQCSVDCVNRDCTTGHSFTQEHVQEVAAVNVLQHHKLVIEITQRSCHTHHASIQHVCTRCICCVCKVVRIVHVFHRAAIAGDVALRAKHNLTLRATAHVLTSCASQTWKPHACRAVAVKMSALAHDGTPFTELYEHMMPLALPRCTHDWNAGRYVSVASCADTMASK